MFEIGHTGVCLDSFTLLGLLRKALAHKGLKLQEGSDKAYSKPIKTYELTEKLLTLLSKKGIRQQDRPDCNNKIFTLVDENPQKVISGWAPSNYWNFKLVKEGASEFDLHISLSVGLEINKEKRGIVFWPQTHSSFLSPCDLLPNFRMFKTLAESDENAPAVAKELAASDGNLVVAWTDLGLGGIHNISDLFMEFSRGNKTVMELGRREKIFNPIPFPEHQKPGDELFIAEPAQPKIFQKWKAQLDEYRAKLIV